jgi:hypothetical protein
MHHWETSNIKITFKECFELFNKVKTKQIPISRFKKILVCGACKVASADISYPIFVVIKNKNYYIIDGNHRINKCINLNINKINAKCISYEKLPIKFKNVFF